MGNFVPIVGLRFGRLTVVRMLRAQRSGADGRVRLKYFCRCDCGGEARALGENLRNGHTQSCGCARDEWVASQGDSVIGQRFGRYVVTAEADPYVSPKGQHKRAVVVRCDCGTVKTSSLHSLRRNRVASCGCRSLDILRKRSTTHGDAPRQRPAPEYRAWGLMIARCENPNVERYPHYGGRGIKVCSRWRRSYPAFLRDMGRKPSAAHSIDRKDVDGNYTPKNCRWATRSQQAANTRRSKRKKRI